MSTAKIDPEAEMEAAFLRRLAKQLGVDELSEEALAKSLGFDSLTDEKLDQWFADIGGRLGSELVESSETAVQTGSGRAPSPPVRNRVALETTPTIDDKNE